MRKFKYENDTLVLYFPLWIYDAMTLSSCPLRVRSIYPCMGAAWKGGGFT